MGKRSNRENYNLYTKSYLKRRYDERRALAIAILGGCCSRCGSTDRLQFDHVEHSAKDFDIADRLAQYAWPRIEAELKKCQLLCFDCHVAKSRIELIATKRRIAHHVSAGA